MMFMNSLVTLWGFSGSHQSCEGVQDAGDNQFRSHCLPLLPAEVEACLGSLWKGQEGVGVLFLINAGQDGGNGMVSS